MFRELLAHLPSRSPARLARHLVRRADAARDARQWLPAAALYEEALALAPYRHRIHIQCGHAYKEAGHLAQAEAHYLAASEAAPNDADLALQLGHFHRTCGHLDAAERAYRRAVALDPLLEDALKELADLAPPAAIDTGLDDSLSPDLLPKDQTAAGSRRDQLVVLKLGREWSREGPVRRVLRGIEAVRAYCLASAPIERVELLVDGVIVRTVQPRRHPLADPIVPAQAKYVANIWHDFSAQPVGEAVIELRFVEPGGAVRGYRAILLVQAPIENAERMLSDSHVPALPPGTDVDAAIDGLPSVVRPARHRAPAASPRTILVQRVDQLGDLVTSVPALQRLRTLFPDARMIGLVSPANADLARSFPWLDKVEIVRLGTDPDSGRPTLAAEDQLELRQRLHAHRFDLAIDLGEGDGSRPLLRLSGAPLLYGFRPRDFPWLSGGVEADVRDPVNGLEAAPHSHRLLMLVESLAIFGDHAPTVVDRPAPDAAMLADVGLRPGRHYVVLHTGARLQAKCWLGFGALARLIHERTDLDLLILGDAGDPPLDLPASPRIHVHVGRMSFDQFDALLAGARVMVGNDSGPKHLAALRGTPVVSIHPARTNWNEWGQEQTGTIISRRVPCGGCGIDRHPEDCGRDLACIRLIQPEEVFAAVRNLLDAPVSSRSRAQ